MHRSTTGNYLVALRAALRADLPIYVMAATYIAVGTVISLAAGGSPLVVLLAYARIWLVNFSVTGPFIFAVIGVIHVTLRLEKRRSLAWRGIVAPERIGRLLAGIVLLLTAAVLFMSTFTSIKSSMSGLGFPYDHFQADLDRAIHFGADAWTWLHPFGDQLWLQRLLEINYNAGWFITCFGLLYWWATSPLPDTKLRVRYFTTFFLTWSVVGNILAALFLSAGPAFYGLVTGDTTRFAGLLAHLRLSDGQFSSTTTSLDYLWSLYSTGQTTMGAGISAFPSMHVALVTLNALFIGELSRKWGAVFFAYVAVVMFSSVYLGWHYAIDGYAALAVTVAIYWTVRKFFPLLARLRLRGATATPAGAVAG